jgi:hypothetical protein
MPEFPWKQWKWFLGPSSSFTDLFLFTINKYFSLLLLG